MTNFSGTAYIYVLLLSQSFWAICNRSTSKLELLDCPTCSDNRFSITSYDFVIDTLTRLPQLVNARRNVWREFEGHRSLTIAISWFVCCIDGFEE